MKALLLIVALITLIGFFNLPIGYYTFLRIVTTIGAIAVIVTEYKHGLNTWVIMFGLIAILFNPIIPIYLHSKSAWKIIDLLTGILFLIKVVFYNHLKSQSNEP